MKANGNDKVAGNYYIGLDVGTNSVGWAVTDSEYNVLRFKGNSMWGVRLFDEAQDASGRRSSRTSRRRLERRNQRLMLLEMLFAAELAKVDKDFITRMHESALWEDDKSTGIKYSLFNDPSFSDKDYYKKYPTIYHLRKELLETKDAHDIRLVYLAVHHIMKSRGHFLYADSGDVSKSISVEKSISDLSEYLAAEYDCKLVPDNKADFIAALLSDDGITAKKKALRTALGKTDGEDDAVSITAIADMLAGASVKFSELFRDDELKDAEIKSFSLKNSLDEKFDELSELLGERIELLIQMKNVFDSARLSHMLEGYQYISDAKVALFDRNKAELAALKKYVQKNIPGEYKHIFSEKKDKLNNYAAYSGYRTKSGDYSCSQEDFCKFLRLVLPEPSPDDAKMQKIYAAIKDGTFLPKLKGSDNGVIPYQLHKRELVDILENASEYLPFLAESDTDGISVKGKIIKTFEFRVPYYVGPLNKNSGHNWAVRFAGKENEKINPWNFETVIDTESSAAEFIENLVGRCTYTGEKVLPKDSLLYSEYTMLNEINNLRVDGKTLSADVRARLITEMFYESRKKVTKKRIKDWLRLNGYTDAKAEISGIDDTVKSTLKSFHDFELILSKTHDTEMVENIIRGILVFGEDKKMLKKWLKKNTHGLDDADCSYICRLKYSDWGRLSETFLTGIYSPDENGEAKTIMDCLRAGEGNLMQLLSDNYEFAQNAAAHRDELLGNCRSLSDKLDELYIAPAVRRSIRQTLRIVDEIVDIEKSAPAKIFIEMARGSAEEMKHKRTESRKSKLTELYKNCHEDSGELFDRLQNEDDNSLRSDKLYLYYIQMGKCMYSGESIDFGALSKGELYDIDHIFPRSKVKDNSIDNRVLVKNTLNREKSNTYPIGADIRQHMQPIWLHMKKSGLISEKKYDRLVRGYELTEKELSDFVARQLVETQQSTKALAQMLKDTYGDTVRIVYSKAGNVADFRQQFDLIKCRDVNDLHHAKDAYLNIVVGNVYCTRFTDRFFANIRKENYSLNKVFEFSTKGAWDKDNSIKTVKKYMAKNNILVSRMPKEVKGKLFDLQLMPAGKGQLEKKQGLDISRYGGYNKLTGAYYCLVEHTVKKKRVRTIEPVYVYCKAMFERTPERYCTEILGLSNPCVVLPKMRVDSLLELDGKRLHIASRTGTNIIYKHTYQLCISADWEKYIKELQKYVDRCHARKTELPLTSHDNLSAEKNNELYTLFVMKCEERVYSGVLGKVREHMVNSRDKFEKMSVLQQAEILLEVLKAFKCNAENPNFTMLCGKGTVGRISKSKDISNLDSAYLVNQSVTGLYETKTDLLK